MGFTLGVENAPAPATQWMAQCNLGAGPNMPGPLLLAQRWNCTEPAPGANWMEIACFDAAGYIVKECSGFVTIEDGKDYTFDFSTETLGEVTVVSDWTTIIGPLLVLGFMAAMVGMMAPMMKKGFS